MRPASHRFGRTGFSLLETLVVASLLLSVVAGAVLYLVSGQKQSVALEFKAASLQSAQLVMTRLQRDLSSLVPGPLGADQGPPTPRREVLLTRVSDLTGSWGLPLDDKDALLTENVSWRFDPATHLVSRNGEPIRAAPMESIEFTFFPCRPGDANPPYGDTLLVRMVVVPTEALGRTTARTPRAVFSASFHSPQGTTNHLHEDWVGDR